MINKIQDETIEKIKMKTPFAHSARPFEEGMNEEQIKGLFYKGITDESASVISEINRIVSEINEASKKAYPPDSIGTIEILYDDKIDQPEGLVTDYALFLYESPTYNKADYIRAVTGYKYTISTSEKYLVLRITAPKGVIPDSNLRFMQGKLGIGGLNLLASSNEEIYNTRYYIDVPILCKSAIEIFQVKWNGEAYTSYMVVDLNKICASASLSSLKLYKMYSTNTVDGKLTENEQDNSKYVGLFIGEEASKDINDYIWFPLNGGSGTSSLSGFTTKKEVLYMDKWEKNSYTLKVEGITADSLVIISPSPLYMGVWSTYGVYCNSQYANHLVFYADTTPEKDLDINLLIGESS